MDMAIIFLVIGWIFGITGLKVTALVLSSIFLVLFVVSRIIGVKFDHHNVRIAEQMIIMSLSIVSILL